MVFGRKKKVYAAQDDEEEGGGGEGEEDEGTEDEDSEAALAKKGGKNAAKGKRGSVNTAGKRGSVDTAGKRGSVDTAGKRGSVDGAGKRNRRRSSIDMVYNADKAMNNNGDAPPTKMVTTWVDYPEEQLGEDFDETPWVPPTVEKALKFREKMIYRGGKSDIWGTKIHELEDMGIGVSLYFQFLKFLTFTFFVMSIISVPAILFTTSGAGLTNEQKTKAGEFHIFLLANIGTPCDLTSSITEYTEGCYAASNTTQMVYGYELTYMDMTYALTAFEMIGAVFFILAVLYWRRQTAQVVHLVDMKKITARDYSVFVEGLPESADHKSVARFFSDLYRLDREDFRGRPIIEGANPVMMVDCHDDKWYLGKWVAEVCTARKVGKEIRAYKKKRQTVMELKRARATAKMYNEGTPLEEGKGENSKKFNKACNKADKLATKIAKTTDKIMAAKEDLDAKAVCVGAFVIFNHPLSLHRCMEDYSKFSSVGKRRYPKEMLFDGTHRLKVLKAPEPDNIVWENVEFSKRQRAMRKRVNVLVASVLLVISFALILSLNNVVTNYGDQVPDLSDCEADVPLTYFKYNTTDELNATLAMIRPPVGNTRIAYDAECQTALVSDTAHYVVYTTSEADDNWARPALDYNLTACSPDPHACPLWDDDVYCPCVATTSSSKCTNSYCETSNDADLCGTFAFTTVSGCYCFDRFFGAQAKGSFLHLIKNVKQQDKDVCAYFIKSMIVAFALSYVVSILPSTINSWLQKSQDALVFWERNVLDDDAARRLMFGVFKTQYINTGILVLLVFGRPPEGYSLPSVMQTLNIFDGDYDDFDSGWYANVGATLLTTIIIACFSPHLNPLIKCFVLAKFAQKKAVKKVREGTDEYALQHDLNQKFVGPVFDFTTRYSYILTILFVGATYSGGIVIIPFILFLAFLTTYWVDKTLLLRYYRRPPHREDALQLQCNEVLPIALFIHLGMTAWMVGTTDSSLKTDLITDTVAERTGMNTEEYQNWLDNYEQKYGVIITRIIRSNVFPLFVMWVLVGLWCFLSQLLEIFPIHRLLGKLLGLLFYPCVWCCCSGKRAREKEVLRQGKQIDSPWTSEDACYTDVYYQYMKPDGDTTTQEKLEGWMVSHLPDGSTVKKKGWDLDQEQPPGRDAKFSWEVIKDNAIHTYHIEMIPGYAEIMGALEEEARMYKLDMEDTGGRSKKEEEEEEEDTEEEEEDEEEESEEEETEQEAEEDQAYNPFNDMAGLEDGGGGAAAGNLTKAKTKGGAKSGGGAKVAVVAADDDYNPFADFLSGMDET